MPDRGFAVRVLIVDDTEQWREFLSTLVTHDAKMVVVGKAVDGFQSVQYAQQLEPDLILLDIGLPALNGIEAARQIARVSPESKVIFVTQQSDPDVREAALSTGARGFILKSRALEELLPAIETVLAGGIFSRAISGPSSI